VELNLPFGGLENYVLATSLATARITSIVTVMPAFTRLGLTGILQAAVAVLFALPLVPALVVTFQSQPVTLTMVVVLVLKEVTVGLVIGVVLGVPFWAAAAAGDIIDVQRGANSANLTDPLSLTEEGINGRLFSLIMVALYYGSGGLKVVLGVVYDSYGIWPAGRMTPVFAASAGQLIVGLVGTVVSMGLMLAAPLVLSLLLADLVLAVVSRSAPHINAFALSMAVKNLVLTLLIVVYCGFLAEYMEHDLGWLNAVKAQLETMAGHAVK